ncbi:MAG: glycosyltransferase family 2 protein [Actinobacteria bacterium]|nr:MAG: glycosyltransferase family 2 protein [Actinomycetota bacterium]
MRTIVLVAAHNEADRLPATLAALREAFPGARVIVADDGSTDATADVSRAASAEVVSTGRDIGKGGAMTAAARRVLDVAAAPDPPVVVLCDGDLGASARYLPELAAAVADGRADLAVAAFARRVGGGVGAAVGFARWAVRSLAGLDLQAPISGQRAMRGEVLPVVVPFAPRFGMEIGMTVDAARAGFRVVEVPLDLEHRATGRTLRGFLHRGRQLADFVAVVLDRR